MEKFFINLSRSSDRLMSFTQNNQHVTDIRRFSAIDGSILDPAVLEASKIVRPGHFYTNGAIGCALSHARLWQYAIQKNQRITIMEDDAILSHQFEHKVQQLAVSRDDWDYIAWGWNFDAPLWVDVMPSVAPFRLHTSQHKMRNHLDNFQKASFDCHLMRLVNCFGTMCYSITPRAAQVFLNQCFPIRAVRIVSSFPEIKKKTPHWIS